MEVSVQTLVPERPVISTAAATTQPVGGGCQPKRKWLSRELVPKPWRGLSRAYVFVLENKMTARVPEVALDSCEFTAPQPAGAGVADRASF